MNTVYKYEFDVKDWVEVVMPWPAVPLHVECLSPNRITLWALVNIENAPGVHKFRVSGTGHPVEYSDNRRYVGTVIDKPFVWHVWKVT